MSFPLAHVDATLNQLAKQLIAHFPEQYQDQIFQHIATDKEKPTSNIGQLRYAIAMSDFFAETLQKTTALFTPMLATMSSLARL
ncbi:glutamate-ammonia-ligase adenylyltransferase [Pasteurella multocida]|nr:glutamate-ammonia-ligase adenylyltransferase [Pasteurella multocida]